MSEWKKVKLGVCPVEIIDGDRGKNYPNGKDFTSYGYCLFLNAKNVTSNGFNFSDKMFISQEKDNQLRKGKIKNGDVILTTRGTVGNICYYDNKIIPYQNMRINSGMVLLRADESYVKSKFLFWAFKSPQLLSQIESIKTGTAQPQLPISIMKNLELYLPPLEEQKAIADVLSALDDKIELNNKINKNLEAQAQAIFKRWFVNFDFPDKNGNPYKSSGGEMISSELGEIPKVWTVENIYKISQIIYGAPFSSKQFNNIAKGKPIIRIRDLPSQKSDVFTDEIHPKGYLLQKGDIVIGMDGEFRAYIWSGDECWLNQRLCVFKETENTSKVFLYHILLPLLDRVEKTEVATTVIHIGKNDFDRFKFVCPNQNLMNSFKNIVDVLFKQIITNNEENQKLAELRDYLLPKLMSGEIKVQCKE